MHIASSKPYANGAMLTSIAIGKNGHVEGGEPVLIATIAADTASLFAEASRDNWWVYLVLGDHVLWLDDAATLHPTASLLAPQGFGSAWSGSAMQLADWDHDPNLFSEARAATLARRLRAADLLERAIAAAGAASPIAE